MAQQVDNTADVPFYAVGYLNIDFGQDGGTASGVLISPYFVLTAGHNFDRTVLKYASAPTAATFTPGLSRRADWPPAQQQPIAPVELSAYWQSPDYVFGMSVGDFALAALRQPITGVSAIPYTVLPDDEVHAYRSDKYVILAGYPAQGAIMFEVYGQLSRFTRTFPAPGVLATFIYKFQTEPGWSGSPLIAYNPGYRVIGVHAFQGAAAALNPNVMYWIASVVAGHVRPTGNLELSA